LAVPVDTGEKLSVLPVTDKIHMRMKFQRIKIFEFCISLHFLVIYGINSEDVHTFLISFLCVFAWVATS
jgi:hypothetical protein